MLFRSYKAVDEIRIETLYPSEVQNFETFKAMFLWQMGDFSTATKLLENERHESNPIKYLLAAFIFEYSGNLDDAYKQMKEAMALCSNTRVSPEYHMQILENYGKIHRLRGNLTEAVCYLQQANKMLEQMDNPRADIQDRKSTRLNPVTLYHLVCRLLLEKNFFNDTATTEIYTLSLHDALPISTRKSNRSSLLFATGE